MWLLTNEEARYLSYLNAIRPIIEEKLDAYLINKKWGLPADACTVKELKLLRTFGLLLEWKAHHINKHHLQYDDNGCPIICHPSQLPEADLFEPCQQHAHPCCECSKPKPPIGGWIRLFNCHNVNIVPALTAWGMYPATTFPDGISYMEINGNTGTCSPNVFEVGKVSIYYPPYNPTP